MNAIATPLSAADREALARDSWIDPATADAFGLYRVTSTEGALLVGRTDREDYAGMVFPVYGPGEDRPKEHYLRRDHPPLEQHDGKLKPKQKYLAPPGRSNRLLFGPGESVDALADAALPLVLVEGLKKTLAAWRLSRHDDSTVPFLACGLSGVWNWRGTIGKASDASGARVDVKGTIPDLDRVTWTNREVCVLFDSDAVTNPKVLAARQSLVRELTRRGAVVTAPDLPAIEGLDKTGFDDLLAQRGPVWVLAWLDAIQETPPTSAQAEVARLASLSILDYGKARKDAAKRLSLSLGLLDTAVAAARKERTTKDDGHGQVIEFEDLVPAFEPVDGPDLGNHLARLFARFATLPEHGAIVLTLWTIFSYCLDLFHIAPRLDLSSPEKQCGKTTVLTLLSRLSFRAALSSNITPAAIFRVISAHKPTQLIDEMDTFIEANEELRGILNSGHTRDAANIIRCDGDDDEPKRFSTWAAMAFAHIGSIPDTLEDRSVRLPMRRRLPSERIESLRQTGSAAGVLHEEFTTLRRQIARWVTDASAVIASANPFPVGGLSDRAVDNWMPLLSIADSLGGTWPEQARKAAQALSGHSTTDNESVRVELLADIQGVFIKQHIDRLSSTGLCDLLALLEERPWGTWKHGKPMTPVQLARVLKPFRVSSKTIRLEAQGTARGYQARTSPTPSLATFPLLPRIPRFQSVTVTQPAPRAPLPLFFEVTRGGRVSLLKMASTPLPERNVSLCHFKIRNSRGATHFVGKPKKGSTLIMTIKVLAPLMIRLNGQDRDCRVGDTLSLPEAQAQRLMRKAPGLVRCVESAPAPPLQPGWLVAYRDRQGRLTGGCEDRQHGTVDACRWNGNEWTLCLTDGQQVSLSMIRSVGQTDSAGQIVAAWTVREHGYEGQGPLCKRGEQNAI